MMKTQTINTIKLLQFHRLSEEPAITHFITTRHGGVSEGKHSSLNVGEYCGDNHSSVIQNRKLLCYSVHIQPELLFVPYQTHCDNIGILDRTFLSLSAQEQCNFICNTDALITPESDICIGVTTADCVSVLLFAPDKRVVAAIHAGWRSTVLQIVRKTVQQMENIFGCNPLQMLAGIGPAISIDAFEVGEEVANAFKNIGLPPELFIRENPATGKAHIDLQEVNRLQLISAGIPVQHIEKADMCTYSNSNDFFSARRMGIQSGRMISGIKLNKK